LFLAATLSVAAGTALSDPFVVGPWHGQASFKPQSGSFSGCVAHANMEQAPQQALLYFSLNSDQSIRIGLKRPGWGLAKETAPTVIVSVNDVQVAKKNATVPLTDLLVIKFAPEMAVRSALERGTVLSIDTGTEVFRYPLTDMQPLLVALDTCVDTRGGRAPPSPTADEARAPSPATDVAGNAAGALLWGQPPPGDKPGDGSTLAQRCDADSANHDFVIYHRSWDHEPTAKERAEMREYTQEVTPCISLWKARCAPLMLFPMGSTNAFCEIRADNARAHLNNRRDFESRNETYGGYNSRADEIDRIYTETSDRFFASVQKPIDDDNERQRQQQAAQDRQAAARREEQLISVLRQLGTPRPVTTQCTGGNGTVQCTTY
jgi:hypothetical protein